MPLDPSIPLQAGQGVTAPLNPLATFGQYAGVANALSQNKLIDANTAQTQQATEGMQQQQLLARLGQMANVTGGILSRYPNGVPPEAVSNGLATMINMGAIKPQEAGALIASLPMGSDPQSTAARTAAVKQFHFQGLSMADQAARIRGVPTTMDNGPSMQPGLMGENGFTPQGGQITKGLTPDVATAPTQIGTDASGRAIYGTRPQFLDATGSPQVPGSFPSSGRMTPPRAAAPAPPPIPAQGPAPAPPAGQAPPQAAPAAPPAAAPRAPGVAIGNPLGAAEEVGGSVSHYVADNAAANSYKARVLPLESAAKALASTNTGPGTETTNQIRSFLLAQTPDSLQKYLPGVDANKIASYDEAKKYLTQYAAGQSGAAGSDTRLATALSGNASTSISNLAARQVVEAALGLERMRQAATLEFNKTHQPGQGGQYDRFLSQFNTQVDPRAFVFDRMSPGDRTKMWNGMNDRERNAYRNGLRIANQNGLIDLGSTDGGS